jgi:hypothetical protein
VVLPPILNQNSNGTFKIVAGDSKLLSYDAGSKTYTVATDYSPAPDAPVSFDASNIVAGEENFTTYQRASPGSPAGYDRLALFIPGLSNTKISLTYSSYGIFRGNRTPGYSIGSYFVFGQVPAAGAPTSGIASYAGVVDGCDIICTNKIGGTSSLVVNFLNSTLKAELNLSFSQTEAGRKSGTPLLAPIRLTGIGYVDTVNSAGIRGELTAGASDILSGTFAGGFYGPNGEEFGFGFNTSMNSAVAGYNMEGVAVGKKQGSVVNPASQTLNQALQAGETFNAANAGVILKGATSGNVSLFPSSQNLLSYDAAADTYILTRDTFSNNGHIQVLRFGSTDQIAGSATFTTHRIADSSDPANRNKDLTISLFKIGPSNSAINLTYASYGYYTFRGTETGVATDNHNFFLYGVATPQSAIPTLGTAAYTGIVDGIYTDPNGTYRISGSSALNANFAGRSLTTSMTFTGANMASGGPSLASQTFAGSANFTSANQSAAGQFMGSLASSAAPSVNGTFFGNFYGPLANEYGYAFRLGNGTTSANSTVFGVGVAVGK